MDFLMLRVNTASDIWRLMAQTAIQPGVANVYCSVVQQSRGTASLAIADQSTCNFEGLSYRYLPFVSWSPPLHSLSLLVRFICHHACAVWSAGSSLSYTLRSTRTCRFIRHTTLQLSILVLLLVLYLQNEQSLPAGKEPEPCNKSLPACLQCAIPNNWHCNHSLQSAAAGEPHRHCAD